MKPDPVLAEVWKAKDAVAAEHGYDLRRLVEALRARQKEHPERVVRLAPRRAKAAPSPL